MARKIIVLKINALQVLWRLRDQFVAENKAKRVVRSVNRIIGQVNDQIMLDFEQTTKVRTSLSEGAQKGIIYVRTVREIIKYINAIP